MTAVREWSFPSSSSSKIYTTRMSADGLLTCDCRGYTFKRGDKPRECTHITKVLTDEGWGRIVKGDFVFAQVDGCDGTVAVSATPVVNGKVVGFVPRSDSLTVSAATVDRALALADEVSNLPPAVKVDPIPEPMKASAMTEAVWKGLLTDEEFAARFNNGQWVMDEKLDGHRLVVRKRGDAITTDYKATTIPEHVLADLRRLPDGTLDGELMVPGGISHDVVNLAYRHKLVYVLFDVLDVMGQSVLHESYASRRAMLELLHKHIPDSTAVVLAPQYEPTLANVRAIWAKPNGEGTILKRVTSTYRPNWRSPDWVKVKNGEHHTVTVTGFEEGSLGPTSIVCFRFDDGVEGRCKNLNNLTLAETAANIPAFIGKRLVIMCQQRIAGKAPRHPMFDHWAGKGE